MSDVQQDAWFYTREGEKIGPVTFSELKIKAAEGELNPRLDMAWTPGMEAWQPSGEIEDLFEKRTAAEPQNLFGPPTDPYKPPKHGSAAEAMGKQGGWPGARRRSYLLVLFFFPSLWLKGFVYSGEAVFYPAAYPLRVAFKTADVAPPFSEISGFASVDNFLKTYAEAMARNPWLSQFPVLLTSVTPVFHKNKFVLVDAEKKCLDTDLSREYREGGNILPWEMIAESGGQPIVVFGDWNGQSLKVLHTFTNA